VLKAIEAGECLIEAKAAPELSHGQWLPFLAKCGISKQTAALYMRVAEHRDEITKGQRVVLLSLREAAKVLAKPCRGSGDHR